MDRWRTGAFLLLGLGAMACGDGASSARPGTGGTRSDDAGALGDAERGSDASSPRADGATADANGANGSRCTIVADAIACDHQTLTVSGRTVAYAVPLGVAPSAGWRSVIYFQGSFVPGDSGFVANKSDTFGRYELTLTIKALLDRGYAVIAPDAANNGSSFWQTNIPPYAQSWPGCADDALMLSLFASISKGDFGPIDSARLYAMGISSGGFMTSRMAVSYAGKFRALANHSASYATCGGQTCSVPTPLPGDHPPMIFLRGAQDTAVSMSIVQPYLDALKAEGHDASFVTDADAGHEWLREGPSAIPSWFDAHP